MKQKENINHKGFTLLELLVVVVIIGILAAIALPQYKKSVERSKMVEAVTIIKTIAQAQQRFYLINNRYADCSELEKLDIDLSGSSDCSYPGGPECTCKKTDNFLYIASGNNVALAQKLPLYKYYLYSTKNDPNSIHCNYTGNLDYQPSKIQKELCDKLNQTGTL